MKKIVLATLVVASVASAAQAQKSQDVGTILGGVVGGLLGNSVAGKGDKTEGAIIGVIAGAVIGNRIGRSMDKSDRRALEEAQRRSLGGSLNARESWDGSHYGSKTGVRGEFITLREGRHRQRGTICREYESVIYYGARREVTRGMACRSQNGSWSEVKTTEVSYDNYGGGYGHGGGYGQGHGGYQPAPMPMPQPPPIMPTPHQGGAYSLAGYCSDYDHSQFYVAKNFAYSGSGLNLFDQEATSWALSYNNNHACGTINEYAARYRSLYNFAYSGSGLNLNSTDARSWALRRVETMDSTMAQEMSLNYQAVYNFAYSLSGINLNSTQARSVALAWVERGYCERRHQMPMVVSEYQKQYNFAYSGSGLNMNSSDARRYAVNQIRSFVRCADLLL